MATYPFINRRRIFKSGISFDPIPLFSFVYVSEILSIRCTNTTNNDISITITALTEENGIPQYTKVSYQEFIPAYKSLDMMEGMRGRMGYLETDDILLANTDSPIKTFDCWLSFKEYLLPNQ